MSIRHVLLSLSCLALCSQAAASSLEQLQEQNERTLKKEISVQAEADQWSAEKQALVDDVLNQKTQLEWNRFQNKKYKQYISHKKENIDNLKRKKEEMGKLRMELEPFLDTSSETLQAMIHEDLPFLPQERQVRITFLTKSLSDPDLKLSEKLRRFLEVSQVEADYGNSVEVTEEKLVLNDEETIVQLLRLGRVALFYLTLDNQIVGGWDRTEQSWKPIDPQYVAAVRDTIDVVQQKRVAELVDLPMVLPTGDEEEVNR